MELVRIMPMHRNARGVIERVGTNNDENKQQNYCGVEALVAIAF